MNKRIFTTFDSIQSNYFKATLQIFNTTEFRYAFTNPFTRRLRLPRVVTRYGGKGNFYEDYIPYIYDIAKASGTRTFVDCFGGGGTIAMAALLMTDYDTYDSLFDKVVYNDIDTSVYSTFVTVKDPVRCDRLVDRILDTKYSRENYEKAHEIIALLNIVDMRHYIDEFPEQFSYEDLVKYIRASQLKENLIPKIFGDMRDKPPVDCVVQALAEAKDVLLAKLSPDDIAYYAYIENAMSFNGDGRGYRDTDAYDRCSIDYERKMYLSAKRLTDICPLLERLEVHNGDYRDIVNDYAEKNIADDCIWFLDPPYYTVERAKGATAVYKNEFNNFDHMAMILLLSAMRHWILCGYSRSIQSGNTVNEGEIEPWQNRVYGILCEMPGVEIYDLGMKARPSSSKAKKDGDPHEILWLKR